METNIQIDKDIIVLTTKTVEFLLSENPDSLTLYIFYIKNAKIQETNSIWNTNTFGMKGLGWGNERYKKAKDFLVNNGFIDEVTRRNNKGQIDGHYLKINYIFAKETINDVINQKYQNPHMDIPTSGFQETNALSNKSINALSNKNESTTQNKGILPEILGKTSYNRLLSVYVDLFKELYDFIPQIKYPLFCKVLKPILSVKTEIQIASLMIIFFRWQGMSGSDTREKDKLISASHPITWFSSSINVYEAYLRNVAGVDLDNEDEVKRFLKDNI